MDLRPGSRWRSVNGSTEVVVVRPGSNEHVLECGGAPMVPLEDADAGAAAADQSTLDDVQVLLGKRYELATAGVEVLCTRAGAGPLTLDGALLSQKGAKPLPSSD